MPDKLFWDILDENRKKILLLLVAFKSEFYLAGGTALALQLGHRDSIDFDFFTDKSFSTSEIYDTIEKVFRDHKIIKTQDKTDTLSVLIDDNIKLSFLAYPYKLVKPLVETEYFNLASQEDIGCMKLSAITSRTENKDYVDLYFILQRISLRELLNFSGEKFPSLDTNLSLKSLVYFDDIINKRIVYKHEHQTDFTIIQEFLEKTVNDYLSQINGDD